MTREEASKTLTQYIDYDAETPDYYEMEKACKVALKALKQAPCEDCISRQAVMDALCDGCELFHRNGEQTCLTKCEEYHFLATLPSIQPKPKTGHWTISPNDYFVSCSECGLHGDKGIYKHYRWCPNCGAKMESEG